MSSLFDDVAVFHDEDKVGVANGRETVSDDERSTALSKFLESFLD